jgi:hypothetical protein
MKKRLLTHPHDLLLMTLCSMVFVSGCTGPLDTATRERLNVEFVRDTYLARVYLGSRYSLEYTNNSVKGRSPTGVFIDPFFNYWYETDASFFERGSSGSRSMREELRAIDRDLDFESFAQGIVAGQLVVIKKLSDKSDQLVFDIETVRRHDVGKAYGVNIRSTTQPRASRIHCVVGKDGMLNLDWMLLQQMLAQLLAPVPSLVTEAQKQEFILANSPDTPLNDLIKLTGFTREKILGLYYTHVFSQSQFPPTFQKALSELLATHHNRWHQELGIRLQNVRVDQNVLILECGMQEISNSAVYYTPELRAGLLFFDGVTVMAKPISHLLPKLSVDDRNSSFQEVIVSISYPYFDERGRRFSETMTYTLSTTDLLQFAKTAINDQELADRSEILAGPDPVQISLSALEAVENMSQTRSMTWKEVQVEIEEWDYEEDPAEAIVKIEGEIKNTGTWIAEDVKVIANGYNTSGSRIRSESTTVYGLLKPGERKRFTITMSTEDMKRFKLFLEWEVVE